MVVNVVEVELGFPEPLFRVIICKYEEVRESVSLFEIQKVELRVN